MRKLCVLLIIVTCCTSLTIAAQEETADWQVALLDLEGQQILFITPDGLSDRIIPLPSDINMYVINPGLAFPPFQPLFQVSKDLRYLAFRVPDFLPDMTPITRIIIADLEAGTCCVVAESPLEVTDEVTLGGFSPDGSQLVAVFGHVYAQPFETRLAVIETATGELTSNYEPEALINSPNIYFGEWTEQGILLHSSCFACEGVSNGTFSIWNPESNALSPTQRYFSLFGERLDGTGEFIESIIHPDYSVSSSSGSMIFAFNAIGYYREGYPPDGLPPVIFAGTPYYEANQITPEPHWVADGRAIFLAPQSEVPAHLVFRDGTSSIVENMTGAVIFLAGTPDGWLMLDRGNYNVIHHSLASDGTVSAQIIAELGSDAQVVQAPVLGTTIEPGFAVIE